MASRDVPVPGPTPPRHQIKPGYLWRQTAETVCIWVETLADTKVTDIDVKFTPGGKELVASVEGLGLCVAGQLHQPIDTESSTWVYETHKSRSGFEIQMEKMVPVPWNFPIKGDCQQATAEMDAQSVLEIAKHYELANDYPTALKFLAMSAERGHPIAKVQLGKVYQLGPHSMFPVGAEDLDRAFELYADCATNNYCGEAMFLVGLAFQEGNGAPRNPVRAVEWLKRCVAQQETDSTWNQGNTPKHTITALFNLGILYQTEGTALPVDYGEAVRWWAEAAEHSFPPALYNLGIMYLNGKGVAKDVTVARDYFQAANRLNPKLTMPVLAAPPPAAEGAAAPSTPLRPPKEPASAAVTPRFDLGQGRQRRPEPGTEEASWAWWAIAAGVLATAFLASRR